MQFITRSFVITEELRAYLEQWAREDDRSVSYILRDILKQECDRREAMRRTQASTTEQKSVNQQ